MKVESHDQSILRRSTMHVLCYATPKDKNGVELMEMVTTFLPNEHIEWYTTTEGLEGRLLHNLEKITLAVVSIATEKDLIDFYFIQHLLSKVVLVLLLPDKECHTIAMGHRLHPCFMCSTDFRMPDLTKVLKSITQHESSSTLKNPFEASTPHCRFEFEKDHWIYAAA